MGGCWGKELAGRLASALGRSTRRGFLLVAPATPFSPTSCRNLGQHAGADARHSCTLSSPAQASLFLDTAQPRRDVGASTSFVGRALRLFAPRCLATLCRCPERWQSATDCVSKKIRRSPGLNIQAMLLTVVLHAASRLI